MRNKLKKSSLLAGVAVAALAFAAPEATFTSSSQGIQLGTPAAAQARISVGFFFDALAPHGNWVRHRDHGFVFVPVNVGSGWRPYTEGHWVYTDSHGWYWVSDEPFGWAAYHYGRWGYQPAYGWYWVPGNEWAPAWVTWRTGTDVVGWAPLAPERRGYAYGAPVRYQPPVFESWVFIDFQFIGSRNLRQHVVPIRQIPQYYPRATQVVNINIENNIFINRPFDWDRAVSVAEEQPVRIQNINFVESPDQIDVTVDADVEQISVFQADIAEAPAEETPDQVAESPEELEQRATLEETVDEVPPEADAPTVAQVEAGEEIELEGEAPPEAAEAPAEEDLPEAAEVPGDEDLPEAADAPAEEEDPATAEAEAEVETPATADVETDVDAPDTAEAEAEADVPAAAEAEADVETPATADVEADADVPATAEAEAEVDTPATADAEAEADVPATADVEAEVDAPATADVETPADAPAAAEAPAQEEPSATGTVPEPQTEAQPQQPEAQPQQPEAQQQPEVDAEELRRRLEQGQAQ